MTALDSVQKLTAQFGELVSAPREFRGEITLIIADAEKISEVCAFAKRELGFDYLVDISSVDNLGKIDWGAVAATDFREPQIKEGKQAEFLLSEWFPWQLVERVGVYNNSTCVQVQGILLEQAQSTPVQTLPEWYF